MCLVVVSLDYVLFFINTCEYLITIGDVLDPHGVHDGILAFQEIDGSAVAV